MLSLKDRCFHPSTGKPYIQSASGGKDNSPEGAQVRLRFSALWDFCEERCLIFYSAGCHTCIHCWVCNRRRQRLLCCTRLRTSGVCQELGRVSWDGSSGWFYPWCPVTIILTAWWTGWYALSSLWDVETLIEILKIVRTHVFFFFSYLNPYYPQSVTDIPSHWAAGLEV